MKTGYFQKSKAVKFALLIVFGLVLMTTTGYSQLANTAWPMYMHDYSHSGVGISIVKMTIPTLKWSYSPGGGCSDLTSSPVIDANGNIYISCDNGILYKVSESGSLVWSYDTGDTITSNAPAISTSGNMYFAGANSFYCVTNAGSLLWSNNSAANCTSPVIAASGNIITTFDGAGYSTIFSLNPTTGAIVDSVSDNTSPAMNNGFAPVIDSNGNFFASFFGDNTNSLIYNILSDFSSDSYINTSTGISTPLTRGSDGTLYFGSVDDGLFAWNSDFSSMKWSIPLNTKINGCIARYYDVGDGMDLLFFGTDSQHLMCCDAQGNFRWSYLTGSSIQGGPAVDPNGNVVVGSNDNYVHVVSRTGNLRWYFNTGNSIGESGPAIGSDGTIYIASGPNLIAIMNPPPPTPSMTITGTPTITATPTFPPAGGGVWPMFRRDLMHNAESDMFAPELPLINWTFKAGGAFRSSPIQSSNGTIYIGCDDGKLYAVNPDGTLKWTFTTGGSVTSSPFVNIYEEIFFGSYDGKFYALNSDGSLKWYIETDGPIVSSPIIETNLWTIYVGSQDNYLYAINYDGTLRWKFLTSSWVDSSPAIGPDGNIYFGSYDNKLYALNPDGNLLWSYTTGDYILSSPSIDQANNIYFGSRDYMFYSLNSKGALRWSYQTGFYIESSPAIWTNTRVAIASRDKTLYVFNTAGSLQWSFKSDNHFVSSPVFSKNGSVIIGNRNNNLYSVDKNGDLNWSVPFGNDIYSSPIIGQNSVIYCGDIDGNFYAIGNQPTPTPTPTITATKTLTTTATKTATMTATLTLTATATDTITATPTITFTPTLTLTETPTIIPTGTPLPVELKVRIPYWKQMGNESTLIVLSNLDDRENPLVVANFFNLDTIFSEESRFNLNGNETKLIFSNEIVSQDGKGYVDLSWAEGNVNVWESVFHKNQFKGYPVNFVQGVGSPVYFPFWQVSDMANINTYFMMSTLEENVDAAIDLFDETGLQIGTVLVNVKPDSTSITDLSEYATSSKGFGVITFPSGTLNIFGLIENLNTQTGYPMKFESLSSLEQSLGNILYSAFWQTDISKFIDTWVMISNPGETDVNTNVILKDMSGNVLKNILTTVGAKKMKFFNLSTHVASGMGTADIAWESGTIIPWSTVINDTGGYPIGFDQQQMTPIYVPFWQVNSSNGISTYLALYNTDTTDVAPTFTIKDTTGNVIYQNTLDAVQPGKMVIVDFSKLFTITNIYGTAKLEFPSASKLSVWGLIFSNKTRTGYPLSFDNIYN